MTRRDTFADDYLEAALFADCPEEAPCAGFSAEAGEALTKQAETFYDAHSADIEAYEAETLSNAGHDLWYTRNGHGCGFWEHDTEAAGRLDAAARDAGGVDLILSNNGELDAIGPF